ncbi:MAG TPA: hypothetical protein VI298_08685 [Geobacteraceae bacterium]
MKKLIAAAVLLLLPVLAYSASVTVVPSLTQPAQECRAQGVVSYAFGTKGGASAQVDTSSAAYIWYNTIDSTGAAANIDLYFNNISTANSRWTANTGKIVVKNSTTYTLRNLSTAKAKTVKVLKCN